MAGGNREKCCKDLAKNECDILRLLRREGRVGHMDKTSPVNIKINFYNFTGNSFAMSYTINIVI